MAIRSKEPVLIVGAGLAGLSCAVRLRREGIPILVLDASDGVGGRVRTDRVNADGGVYQVDRGFQVYLTAYPEGRRVLRIPALELRSFLPGAMVRFEGRFWRVADPLRAPLTLLGMLRSPLMTVRDAPAVAMLDTSLRLASEARCWNAPEETTEQLLRGIGISARAIDRIFRPFFGGVFLDRSLKTSARKFRATYRMFARGRAALPAAGMQAIPAQLAGMLDSSALRTGRAVTGIGPGEVTLASGDIVGASAIVVATDGNAAARLLPDMPAPSWKATATLSFAAQTPPSREPILYLDGDGSGPANHVAVISNVQPQYAPPGRSLISASVVAPHDPSLHDSVLEPRVRSQLREWFGGQVDDWRYLRTDFIQHALPSEDAPALEMPRRPVMTKADRIFVAGDHVDNASINGALESGRRAAEAVLACVRAGATGTRAGGQGSSGNCRA
ncbi:MAG: NAD(P)/FAD-dependent oxidoreductase [Phycisphaerales bacterium]